MIATAGEVLPMDSRRERAMVSALVDGRRVVALQILFVGVETTHVVDLLARDRVELRYKRCDHLAEAPGKHDRPVASRRVAHTNQSTTGSSTKRRDRPGTCYVCTRETLCL